MPQTPETRIALERDNYLCMWCYYKHSRKRGVFQGPLGTSALGGGHHVFGRRNADKSEVILGLCSECHSLVEAHKISRCDIISLMEFITKNANLHNQYSQFHKCTEIKPWLEIADYGANMSDELPQKMVILRFSDNWADEINVSGFKVLPAWEWNILKDILVANLTEPIRWSVGSNEQIEWDNAQDMLSNITAVALTHTQFMALKQVFGSGADEFTYGLFPDSAFERDFPDKSENAYTEMEKIKENRNGVATS